MPAGGDRVTAAPCRRDWQYLNRSHARQLRSLNLAEQLANLRRRHGEIGLEKQTREMQTDGLAVLQVDDRRARVAAERRAVVLQFVGPDVGDLAGREALLLVDVAENPLRRDADPARAGRARDSRW